MGWWSATILGGDGPMDYIGDMEQFAKLPAYDPNTDKEMTYTPAERRTKIEAAMPKLIKYCKQAYDVNIAYQVLGVLIITCGAKISADLRAQIIQSSLSDEWYLNGDKERQFYIRKFVRQLHRYPLEGGRPRQIAYEGLFDVMSKHVGGGLINKNL